MSVSSRVSIRILVRINQPADPSWSYRNSSAFRLGRISGRMPSSAGCGTSLSNSARLVFHRDANRLGSLARTDPAQLVEIVESITNRIVPDEANVVAEGFETCHERQGVGVPSSLKNPCQYLGGSGPIDALSLPRTRSRVLMARAGCRPEADLFDDLPGVFTTVITHTTLLRHFCDSPRWSLGGSHRGSVLNYTQWYLIGTSS